MQSCSDAAGHAPHSEESGKVHIEGFVGPAHVSTIIGSEPYETFAKDYSKPVVIAGFEPLDMLQSILMLIRQINRGEAEVENEFTRRSPRRQYEGHSNDGRSFALRDSFEWRGLGSVPKSALKLSDAYSDFDAEKHFNLVYRSVPDNKACECGAILRGENSRLTVVHSERYAHRKALSAPAWYPAKAPAPLTSLTADTRDKNSGE